MTTINNIKTDTRAGEFFLSLVSKGNNLIDNNLILFHVQNIHARLMQREKGEVQV